MDTALLPLIATLLGGLLTIVGGYVASRRTAHDEQRKWLRDEKKKAYISLLEAVEKSRGGLTETEAKEWWRGVEKSKDVLALFASDSSFENINHAWDAYNKKEISGDELRQAILAEARKDL